MTDETERIDLAVKFGVPTFMDVLKEVGNDMKIEKIVLAEEIKEYVINKKAFSETDPETYEYFEDLFSESESIEEILKIK